jgi:hypothetical protein
MKKIILLFILSFVLSPLISAQTPQFYNYGTTNGGNTLPLGAGVGSLVQWLILPGDLNKPKTVISGNITNIYFMLTANLGPYDYKQVSILLGQTYITSLQPYVFYLGQMDTAYYRDSVTISKTGGGGWLRFTLDHPFLYDSTQSLVIQLEHYGFGGGGTASYIQPHTFLTGNRRNYCTVPPFVPRGQDAYVVHFGVDISPVSGIEHPMSSQVPKVYNLEQNYPNPFNPVTKINFDLPKFGFITLKIYDILGQEIATLVNGTKNAGRYNVDFDGSSISSGMYFYKIESNGFVATKKMMLIK